MCHCLCLVELRIECTVIALHHHTKEVVKVLTEVSIVLSELSLEVKEFLLLLSLSLECSQSYLICTTYLNAALLLRWELEHVIQELFHLRY